MHSFDSTLKGWTYEASIIYKYEIGFSCRQFLNNFPLFSTGIVLYILTMYTICGIK